MRDVRDEKDVVVDPAGYSSDPHDHSPPAYDRGTPLENLEKSRWERSWPTIACGAGLFSDGYLNGGWFLFLFLFLVGQIDATMR